MKKHKIWLSRGSFVLFYEAFNAHVSPARTLFVTVPPIGDTEKQLELTDTILLRSIYPVLYAQHAHYWTDAQQISLNLTQPQHLALYRWLQGVQPLLERDTAIILQAIADNVHWVLTNGKSQKKP